MKSSIKALLVTSIALLITICVMTISLINPTLDVVIQSNDTVERQVEIDSVQSSHIKLNQLINRER